jgi:phage-related protein
MSHAARSIYIKTYTGIVERALKPVRWIGSSRQDLKTFRRPVQRDVGEALYAAQRGVEYPSVRALKGFGGRAVLEIVAPHAGDAYRAVYTVRFHKQRLAAAERDYRERQN